MSAQVDEAHAPQVGKFNEAEGACGAVDGTRRPPTDEPFPLHHMQIHTTNRW